jgi:hypothetical protein
MLRAHLAQRGHGGSIRTGGAASKGDGMKGWLEEHAPNIARQTAQRFEDVAKAVAAKYELPARIAKQLTFAQLVTADEKVIDKQTRRAQAGVFDFVAGTSQKSWLDEFRPAKPLGGAHHAACPFCGGRLRSKKQETCPHCEKKLADYDPNDPTRIAHDLWLTHLDFLEADGIERCSWKDLPQADLERLDSILLDLTKARRKARA